MGVWAGIDLGTSGAKLLVVDERLRAVDSCRIAYPWQGVELDLSIVLGAFDQLLPQLLSKHGRRLEAIGLSTAMHSLVLLDSGFRALTPLITWADLRSAGVFEKHRNSAPAAELVDRSGTPFHPMSPLLKIRHFHEREPALFRQTRYFADLKSLLIQRLTGRLEVDYSLASATGLWNARTIEWDAAALEFARLEAGRLPDLAPPTNVYRHWIWRGQKQTVPLVIGASDGCLANLSTTFGEKGAFNLTLGTSAALRVNLAEYRPRSHQNLFCYYLAPDLWVLGGASNNAGNLFGKEAEKPPVLDPNGMEPLLLPYRYGERSPLQLLSPLYGFIGREMPDSPAQVDRLLEEAVLLNLRWIKTQLDEEIGAVADKLYLSGGLLRRPGLSQMVADAFDTIVYRSDELESSALGAILLSWQALGRIDSFAGLSEEVRYERIAPSGPMAVDRWKERFDFFVSAVNAYLEGNTLPR